MPLSTNEVQALKREQFGVLQKIQPGDTRCNQNQGTPNRRAENLLPRRAFKQCSREAVENPLREGFSGNFPQSCLAVSFHWEPNGGAASPAPAPVGGTAEQQWGPSSIPPYLEELVEEEGEPIRQHLLGHRLRPRGARRRCMLRTKPNHVSLRKPASGSGNSQRWERTSILSPAPRTSGHGSQHHRQPGMAPGAGRQQDEASPASAVHMRPADSPSQP